MRHRRSVPLRAAHPCSRARAPGTTFGLAGVQRALHRASLVHVPLYGRDGDDRVHASDARNLEREHGGVRVYGGLEGDAQGRPDMRQAWLCPPTSERAREIVLACSLTTAARSKA
jgi:hypothetical protein